MKKCIALYICSIAILFFPCGGALGQETGFIAEYFEDDSSSQLNQTKNSSTTATPQVELSLSTYVDDLALKAQNAQRILAEGRIRFYRGVFVLN